MSEENGKLGCYFKEYEEYLVVPRSVLQSMPVKWQHALVELLIDLDDKFKWRPKEGKYSVQLKNSKGMFVPDRLREYRGAPWKPEDLRE